MKKRALISVYDKSRIVEFAAELAGMNWEIVSTGGTAAHLRKAGFEVIDAAEVTGFSEFLDGRVKTLHPAVHAGILARRREKSHQDELAKLNIQNIDLVVVNLYPFAQKASQKPALPLDELVDFVDIGGPAMLRSAAKNSDDVIVLCDPADYGIVIQNLKSNKSLTPALKRWLAGKAFNLTSSYDAAVSQYLLNADIENSGGADFPPYYGLSLKRSTPLRYGENPQQKAALYLHAEEEGAIAKMEQLGGKELGYNNYRDIDIAWKAVCTFGLPESGLPAFGADEAKRLIGAGFEDVSAMKACAAVKHNTLCGAALGASCLEAFDKTYSCDKVSIFGGILAFNAALDVEAAEKINSMFFEIVIAPAYDAKALEILRRKSNLCVMLAAAAPSERMEYVSVDGALLVQEVNGSLLKKWDVVTKTPVDGRDIPDMLFGMRTAIWVRSNAIIAVKGLAAVGIGGGQTSRIRAAEQALHQAALSGGESARVLVSDAFFPFPDVVEAAAAAGIKTIVQSGGSGKDALSIEACDKHGIAMVFTGTRCFKH
jgi:phosphoribosylaminoimidazolecarboxamide formyltransferase/IMP cyclohydrolase